jgi:hypothetical protein
MITAQTKYDKDMAKEDLKNEEVKVMAELEIIEMPFCKKHMNELEEKAKRVIMHQIDQSGDFKE